MKTQDVKTIAKRRFDTRALNVMQDLACEDLVFSAVGRFVETDPISNRTYVRMPVVSFPVP